jgi:cyclic beta-1,2-glucan synthetase
MFRHGSARYQILVENPSGVCRGVAHVELDGKALPAGETHIVLVDDGRTHDVRVILGVAVVQCVRTV